MSTSYLQRLVEVMDQLRSPGGCPWDAEQTHDTLLTYLIEETYELADAIADNNWAHIKEELGDLLLQVVFHSQMASEQGHFSLQDVIDAISDNVKKPCAIVPPNGVCIARSGST